MCWIHISKDSWPCLTFVLSFWAFSVWRCMFPTRSSVLDRSLGPTVINKTVPMLKVHTNAKIEGAIFRCRGEYYTSIRLLYKHPTTIQASDHYTSIRLLYKHPITMQSIRLLYKHPITIQASDDYTSIRLLWKHPITIQASDYHTSIRLPYKHPITMQASDY